MRNLRACSFSRMRVMSWAIVTAPRTVPSSSMGAVESTIVPRVPSNLSMSTTMSAVDRPCSRACAAGQSSGLSGTPVSGQ